MNEKTKAALGREIVPAEIFGPEDEEFGYIGFRKARLGIPDQINNEYHDPVVLSIPKEFRPQPSVVCQHCPGACFFSTHNALNCYCKHMNTLSWSSSSPIPITRCTAQPIFVAQWKAKQAEGG